MALDVVCILLKIKFAHGYHSMVTFYNECKFLLAAGKRNELSTSSKSSHCAQRSEILKPFG